MREFVAVNDSTSFEVSILKREALMFDRIAIPNFLNLHTENIRHKYPELTRNLEWLFEHGIVFEPGEESFLTTSEDSDKAVRGMLQHGDEIIKVLFGFDSEEYINRGAPSANLPENILEWPKELINHIRAIAAYGTRLYSIALREKHGMDTCVVTNVSFPPVQHNQADKENIMQVVLNSIPTPDASTPWEQIIEFRSDPDSRNKFLDLRNWMSEVARAELKSNEVAEKLEYLVSQYQRHMELHRIKTNTGTLETIVVTGAEVLGDLVSFKWGKAAQALFSLKKRNIALLEGELTAPGNEVAYIVKAREHF